MTRNNIAIKQVDWKTHSETLKSIRTRVFIDEQKIAAAEEWDELDETAAHFIAYHSNPANNQASLPVGTVRLLPNGKITRMAVLANYRTQGIGKAIIDHLIASRNELKIPLLFADAQISALGFYEKLGFATEGEEFLDAGIPHKRITLALK